MKGGVVVSKLKRWYWAGMAASLALMPALAGAQFFDEPQPPGPPGRGLTLARVETILQTIVRFLIIFGVIIAVILIIWGGITWMWAGGDDKAVDAAKKRVKNGVIGAAIILGVAVILQTLANLLRTSFFN